MMIMNNSPMLPNFKDGLLDLDTEIAELFERSQEYLEKFPEIGERIEGDLDRAALVKKSVRMAEKRFTEAKEIESGGVLFNPRDYETGCTKLKSGRPRMSAELVFFFTLLRGLWGSVSDHDAWERIRDSISIRCVLASRGLPIPHWNTIRENLNKLSNDTRRLILRCQAMDILKRHLDDFNEVYIDSTHMEANTAFPTDVDILWKLLDRAIRSILALEKFGLFVVLGNWTTTRMEKMGKHRKSILMNAGKTGLKGKIREHLRSFLGLADNVLEDLAEVQEALTPQWETTCLGPEKGMALDMLWDGIEQDLTDAAYVSHCAWHHLSSGKPLSPTEKILSVSDRDAAYIQKGQRIPVIGYKPQVARSRNGFVVGCVVPVGNASDSAMLVPTVQDVISTTGVTPVLVSTDDGYASAENEATLREEIGVLRVSIGGSKGKKLTEDDVWNSDEFVAARRQRSAAESGIFTLKNNHNFGQLRRRGIDAVEAECLEKVIAYNFRHMARLQRRLDRYRSAEERLRGFEDAA